MLIHLVRHAHAGSRRNWPRADEERPLSRRGEAQAAIVSRQLAGDGIDTLWSSPYVRCVQTLEPLAEEAGLTVEVLPCLAEGGSGAVALDTLLGAAGAGHTVAACSHGDVIPAIVAEAVRRGAELDGPAALVKAARYQLTVRKGRVRRVTHIGAPDGAT